MRGLQAVIVGSSHLPEPNDSCPYCGEVLPVVELVEYVKGQVDKVIDRGCERCVKRRNDW